MTALLHRPLRLATIAVASLVWFGGSTGPATARADDLCGCWEGTWHGCTDGLDGIVKAKITKCGSNKYRAVFSGWAFKIMPYRYVAYLTGHEDPATGKTVFRCTMKLGVWDCYWMNGWAKGCKFYARYHTDDHVGYFKMRRVSCK